MTTAEGDAPSRDALERFERRTDANGLFLRYAAGRVRGFGARQVLTVVGAGALGLIEAPWLGLVALVLGFAGDAVDTLFLRMLGARFRDRTVPRGWRRAALALGAFQGATIAASVALAWTQSADPEIAFFATAFLMGATINAGLARPYCAPMADMRLALFALTLCGLTLRDALVAPDVLAWLRQDAYFLIASVMLCYASWNFLRYAGRNFHRSLAMERQLLGDQHALALSTAALASREAQARKLALVAEQANDSIILCDAEGRIEWVNPAFTRITGHPPEAVIGRTPGEVLKSDASAEDAVAAIVEARAAGRPWRVEILNTTRDGHPVWIETSGTQILDAEGRPTMTIQVERDITVAKHHAAALAEASARAAAAAEARSRFLATMSHEIRTPMNGVIGMAGLLAETGIDAEQRGYVEAIIESGRSLLSLINDILDLSRLEAGRMQIAAQPMNATAVVQGVARLLRPLAEGKGLRFAAPGPEAPAVWVTGDAGRLQQVLTNLIGNAVRFTREGGIEVTMQAATGADGRVALSIGIADTGVGIPPDRQEAIFDSFTQSDNSTSREFGGTGLGLAIARQLARLMGGDIALRSAPGEGSVFTLALDLPAAAAPEAPRAEALPVTPRLAGRRILVAEDNGTNRLILRKLIERTGATLDEAVNGVEAVAAFVRNRPDFVFLDMQMPVMDGLGTARAIRAAEAEQGAPRCPMVMLTANAFAEDAAASRAVGCDAFLTKPVMPAEIYDALDRFLGDGAVRGAA